MKKQRVRSVTTSTQTDLDNLKGWLSQRMINKLMKERGEIVHSGKGNRKEKKRGDENKLKEVKKN